MDNHNQVGAGSPGQYFQATSSIISRKLKRKYQDLPRPNSERWTLRFWNLTRTTHLWLSVERGIMACVMSVTPTPDSVVLIIFLFRATPAVLSPLCEEDSTPSSELSAMVKRNFADMC